MSCLSQLAPPPGACSVLSFGCCPAGTSPERRARRLHRSGSSMHPRRVRALLCALGVAPPAHPRS
eukprot:2077569-Rhodomonas_salina.1